MLTWKPIPQDKPSSSEFNWEQLLWGVWLFGAAIVTCFSALYVSGLNSEWLTEDVPRNVCELIASTTLPIFLILAPLGYLFFKRTRSERYLRHATWAIWPVFVVSFLVVYADFAHPDAFFYVSTDEPLRRDSEEFRWKYFLPYYTKLAIAIVLLPTPSILYWVRRFRSKGRV
jgi:hypothetical protein